MDTPSVRSERIRRVIVEQRFDGTISPYSSLRHVQGVGQSNGNTRQEVGGPVAQSEPVTHIGDGVLVVTPEEK